MSLEGNFSRRDFLKLSGLLLAYPVVDSIFAHILDSRLFATYEFWSALETRTLGLTPSEVNNLHHSIERKYNIDIVDPSEQRTVPSDKVEDGVLKETNVPILHWEGPELMVLDQSLATLPAHMYLPGKDFAVQTGFFLLPYFHDPNRTSPIMECKCGPNFADIWINRHDYSTLAHHFNVSRSRVTHELAHKVSFDKGLIPAALFSQLGVNNFYDLSVRFKTIDNPQKDQAVKLARPASLKYGATSSDEFTSEGAEVYLRGPTTFLDVYSPFLGPENSATYYTWLKNNIFEGTEYS